MNDYQSSASELEALLSEDVEAAKLRESTAFDKLSVPFTNSIVLFGAGNLGRKVLSGLRSIGLPVLAFADNNRELWGKEIEGVRVFSADEAAKQFGNSAVFIMTIWRGEGTDTMKDRCQPLADLGCVRVINFGSLFWKYPEIFLPHYSFDLPHKVLEQASAIRKTFDLWGDEASRAEFVAQIRWRLHLDFDGLPRPVQHEIYFPDDLAEDLPGERLVDCGAFDGDTVESFLRERDGKFAEIHAFEADPGNFGSLRDYVAALPPDLQSKIRIYPLAVGGGEGKVFFDPTGTESSAVGHGSLEIDCTSLDIALAGFHPSWIKMDIEGSEPLALAGAEKIIAENTPVLAICVYHLQSHVWDIPLKIRSLSEKYRFFLRPHLLESWDLVCYAIPFDRLIRGDAK